MVQSIYPRFKSAYNNCYGPLCLSFPCFNLLPLILPAYFAPSSSIPLSSPTPTARSIRTPKKNPFSVSKLFVTYHSRTRMPEHKESNPAHAGKSHRDTLSSTRPRVAAMVPCMMCSPFFLRPRSSSRPDGSRSKYLVRPRIHCKWNGFLMFRIYLK